jgi:hypothetical protein
MVYFAMALALFADDDYEEVAARLTDTLAAWDCWDVAWAAPTSGGITQARARLGAEPVRMLFEQVAVPVAGELTRGAFVGGWRVMAIDGFEWDAPDTGSPWVRWRLGSPRSCCLGGLLSSTVALCHRPACK